MKVTFIQQHGRFSKGSSYEIDELTARILAGKGIVRTGELDAETIAALSETFADKVQPNKEVKPSRVRKKAPQDVAFENGDPVDGEVTV